MKRTKQLVQKIARERIRILLRLAFENIKTHPERSRRYIELLRKIGLRTNVRLKKLKRLFCKNCNTLLIPGFTARVRLSKNHKTVNVTCLYCGKTYRYPYKPKEVKK